jgi:DNA-binding response OmpR family regulator
MVLDMNMPDFGGMEIYKRLRKQEKLVPVVLSSGYNKNEDEVYIHSSHLHYLKKPYRLKVLRKVMRDVIAGKS